MSKILNKAQAEAVYSAMCALNNVGASLTAELPCVRDPKTVVVRVLPFGCMIRVVLLREFEIGATEDYKDQAEFAAAYSVG